MQSTYKNQAFKQALINKINQKTKPQGSLGKLENIALQIGLIQETLTPKISHPTLIIFAADHGIVAENVSPFPQEVTWQMVLNFLNGGAAINVFVRQNGWQIKVVDAGINNHFSADTNIYHYKINHGTKNFLHEAAMSEKELQKSLEIGGDLVLKTFNEKSNCIAFGEMGIGNTSAAAMIMSKVMNIPISDCVGRGTGLNDEGLKKKINVLEQASKNHITNGTLDILKTYGGFEIAMIVGGILKAAEHKMIIVIDGFIVTSALLIAHALQPSVLDYCIFAHQSDENGHHKMLNYLNADPLLKLNMRLGEGTGAALALPLIHASINFLNEMASFDSASVSDKV